MLRRVFANSEAESQSEAVVLLVEQLFAEPNYNSLIGQLDMAAVATAMQASPNDRARMATWTGTLTLWVGSDGKVVRNAVHLVIPSNSGPTAIDAEVDLSDLDAPLTVTLP